MKNIHLIPTDKPTRLVIDTIENKLSIQDILHEKTINVLPQNIYITSDKEIKEGDWFYSPFQNEERILKYNKFVIPFPKDKKIILTTDQELIKEGVQAINDEFLECFVKNPSCEEVEVDRIELNTDYRSDWKQKFRYKLIIPKEEQKQHLIDMMQGDEELGLYDDSTRYAHNNFNMHETNNYQALKQGYEAGATEMAKKRYSEEELKEAFRQGQDNMDYSEMFGWDSKLTEQQWFEQFKKK